MPSQGLFDLLTCQEILLKKIVERIKATNTRKEEELQAFIYPIVRAGLSDPTLDSPLGASLAEG